MNAFAISSLSIFISCAIIGTFTYLKGKPDRAAVVFTFFSFVICFWGLGGYKIATTDSKIEAIYWWQIAYIGILCPAIYTHFVFTLLNVNKKSLLYVIYATALIFVILAFLLGERFFGILRFNFGQFYWPRLSKYYGIPFLLSYIIFYWVFLNYCFFLTLKAFIVSTGSRRQQLKWLIISNIIGWLGAHFNFLQFFGVTFYPYLNFSVVLYLLLVAYSILRYKFLNIEVIIKKTLIFGGIFFTVYAVFAFFAILGQVFFERFITQNRWVSMIPSIIVITITLRPLENFLVNITDRYLFQKRYNYKELLKTFASEVLSVLELGKLVSMTEEKLAQIMKLEYCKVVITDNIKVKTEAVLKVPISINVREIGMLLLGKKKSDEAYTNDDMIMLQSLSNTLAIAISNANLADELTKAQVRLSEKDKMATIGTLAAGMAHEIRNPVTTIRVFSEYVSDRLKDKEFTDRYKYTVIKEVDKIDHIIQTLIDFSGEEAEEKSTGVSVYEAVEELISIISREKDILGRIRLINNIPANLVKARVNKEELDEVILNLTQNAIHAISDNGAIVFNAREEDSGIIIEISDTGSGMSEETIAHIFDPFFTTKSKGFGLGLFVVKELVQRNKGNISVESRLGEGTKFYLRFKKFNKVKDAS